MIIDCDYTPDRWRKAGRRLTDAGAVYPDKPSAIEEFSRIVSEVTGEESPKPELKDSGKVQFWITNPRTLESRILTIEDEGCDGVVLSFQHC